MYPVALYNAASATAITTPRSAIPGRSHIQPSNRTIAMM
jgi:hypothetical protein